MNLHKINFSSHIIIAPNPLKTHFQIHDHDILFVRSWTKLNNYMGFICIKRPKMLFKTPGINWWKVLDGIGTKPGKHFKGSGGIRCLGEIFTVLDFPLKTALVLLPCWSYEYYEQYCLRAGLSTQYMDGLLETI